MEIDAEVEVWRREWQSEPPVLPDLRRNVERQSRFMKLNLLGDVLVTIFIGGGTIAWALRTPRPDILLLALVTWIFLAAAWTFSVTLNRGNWLPSALNAAAFVHLSIRRCRARLAAIRFGALLYAAQIVFCLSWIYRHEPHRPFSFLTIALVSLATLLFYSFLFWFRRRKLAELAYFLELQKAVELTGGAIGSQS
ncbi:MAG: hypothetical protein ABJF23_33290 [Bryobacteraceae bacterium]